MPKSNLLLRTRKQHSPITRENRTRQLHLYSPRPTKRQLHKHRNKQRPHTTISPPRRQPINKGRHNLKPTPTNSLTKSHHSQPHGNHSPTILTQKKPIPLRPTKVKTNTHHIQTSRPRNRQRNTTSHHRNTNTTRFKQSTNPRQRYQSINTHNSNNTLSKPNPNQKKNQNQSHHNQTKNQSKVHPHALLRPPTQETSHQRRLSQRKHHRPHRQLPNTKELQGPTKPLNQSTLTQETSSTHLFRTSITSSPPQYKHSKPRLRTSQNTKNRRLRPQIRQRGTQFLSPSHQNQITQPQTPTHTTSHT